jgi:thiamine-monophosphate kinase
MLTEFELIERYFQTAEFQTDPHQWTMTNNGDDCALLRVPEAKDLVCSVDTLVAGVHFPEASSAFDIGYRALAAAVSDLAAMGATPAGFYLALTLPNNQESWISGFADGLLTASRAFSIPLLGGDTTKGPLNIGIHVQGLVPKGQALLRCGAKPGDIIFISGHLGEAAAALASVLEDPKPNSPLKHRFFRPEPRLALGERLRYLASACIDVSDGLIQDLSHLCRQSGTRAQINIEQLPLSAALEAAFDLNQSQGFMLTGGDDYELCFTVAVERAAEVAILLDELSLPGKAIGQMLEAAQSETHELIDLLDANGKAMPIPSDVGFQHF